MNHNSNSTPMTKNILFDASNDNPISIIYLIQMFIVDATIKRINSINIFFRKLVSKHKLFILFYLTLCYIRKEIHKN